MERRIRKWCPTPKSLPQGRWEEGRRPICCGFWGQARWGDGGGVSEYGLPETEVHKVVGMLKQVHEAKNIHLVWLP